MRDALHDEIDYTEDLRERARGIALMVWGDKLGQVMELARGSTEEGHPGSDIMAGLEALAVELAEELADITTEAVHQGGEFGKRLAGR